VLSGIRSILMHDYSTPWLKDDLNGRLNDMSLDEILNAFEAVPPGVSACHNSSLFSPAQVPSLIGVRERKYLDHTGHVLQRDIGDLMRFEALVQGNTLAGFGSHKLPAVMPVFAFQERMSDAQLYALARYLYSLQPPPNPNRRSTLSKRGAQIFRRQGCEVCHTAPLYTNNTLTPVQGFTPPAGHLTKYAVTQVTVGTDATLALRTRKGTGYYKVPSLKGVWYRGPFEHNGSLITLEDWFDARRLRGDYVPTGFKGYAVKTRAVPGHEFGLKLGTEDKKALLAFLKTL
jgi:mono/diheme cytochrome c family protein